ncbi:MAG: ribosome biogenesis GTPase YlqF [Peptococcaceae bacterium]|nr:ribosome biogenesis GTPase YlqF [Peptococcaceae bacterium]
MNTPETDGIGSWYPGHMARARRLIRESLKLVDAVVEIRDARVPLASGHPGLSALAEGKRTLLVLNRLDLADPAAVAGIVGRFQEQGQKAVAVDSRTGSGVPGARRVLSEMAGPVKNRDARCMVVGLPNVGKSAFINRVAGKRAAATANRPGVTRGVQWIRLAPGLDLLDTPGVLWPEGVGGETFYKLAACGILAAESYDPAAVAAWLWERLSADRPGVLPLGTDAYTFLAALGRSRGLLRAGGVVDEPKAAVAFLQDFRSGRLGRFVLDH